MTLVQKQKIVPDFTEPTPLNSWLLYLRTLQLDPTVTLMDHRSEEVTQVVTLTIP